MPRKDRSFRNLVREAINGCDCSRAKKITMRFAMAMNRNLRKEVEHAAYDHLSDEGQFDGDIVFGSSSDSIDDQLTGIDLEKFEKLLQILIKYLPQLIEIFVNLFANSNDGGTFAMNPHAEEGSN